MIEVAALTSGAVVPSARFRVRQHIPALREAGLRVHEFVPAVSRVAPKPPGLRWLPAALALPKLAAAAPGVIGTWRCDVTWLQRALLPGVPTLEPLLRRPLVFDVDDAIWLHRPFGERTCRGIARRARVVIAGNRCIADWFRAHARDVRIVPTAVDTERFQPRPPGEAEGDELVIGWIGTSGNLRHLEAIGGALARVLADFPRARLVVVSDGRPGLGALPPERVRHVPWSVEVEARAVAAMDVGLMPLADDPWTRGKCGFKMLQYMACGVPVVVSPVGVNAELLGMDEIGFPASTSDEWADALLALARSPDLRRHCGAAGRRVAVAHFSVPRVAALLAAILREAASG
jgi:glycosyltransferase involved in cell wall biosynthesis